MFLQVVCLAGILMQRREAEENDMQVVGCPNSTDEGG